MKEIYIIYKTDSWHSYNSRDLIGIGTDKTEALNICIDQANRERKKIDSEQIDLLTRINQTQGYLGEGEFVLEPIEVNKLL